MSLCAAFYCMSFRQAFQRLRHYGLLANSFRAANLACGRQLLVDPRSALLPEPQHLGDLQARVIIIESAARCPLCKMGVMIRILGSPRHSLGQFSHATCSGQFVKIILHRIVHSRPALTPHAEVAVVRLRTKKNHSCSTDPRSFQLAVDTAAHFSSKIASTHYPARRHPISLSDTSSRRFSSLHVPINQAA